MTSILFIDLAIVVYVLVDDWYRQIGVKLLKGKWAESPHLVITKS